MSSSTAVVSLGTVRSILRGLPDTRFSSVMYEVIDDREHSKPTISNKVFFDFRPETRCMTVGFEHSASKDDIDKTVKWNPTNEKHITDSIATAGQGLRFFECTLKAKHKHLSVALDNPNKFYESEISTMAVIEESVKSDVSEVAFQNVLDRVTGLARERSGEELMPAIKSVFENSSNEYPFSPKTVFHTYNIGNEQLIADLNTTDFVQELKKRLLTKYFDELKNTDFQLYVRFPKEDKFVDLKPLVKTGVVDVIGSTTKHKALVITIVLVNKATKVRLAPNSKKTEHTTLHEGSYVFKVDNSYWCLYSNGKTAIRVRFSLLSDDDSKSLQELYTFTQYVIPDTIADKDLKTAMIKSSGETYAGIYVRFGNTFINDEPAEGGGLRRNLPGASRYRAIFELANSVAKSKLKINGLKSRFSFSDMPELNVAIEQCQTIYKHYFSECEVVSSPSADSYIPSRRVSNEVTAKTDDPGLVYIVKIGTNFYKWGKSGNDKKKLARIASYFTEDDVTKLKNSFPNETIYDLSSRTFVLLTPSDHISSYECWLGDKLCAAKDKFTTYASNGGGGVREYFHMEDKYIADLLAIATAYKDVE